MSFNESFQEFPTIETKRFILRELRPDDAEDYFNYFSDPDVTKYWGYDSPKDAKTVKSGLLRQGNAFKRKEVIEWGISEKESDKIIGICRFGNFVRGSMANISYNLSKNHWRKGIMTEAFGGILPFGFHNLGLHRIQAMVMPENSPSIGLLEKHGFQKEGLLREYSFGKLFTDTLLYSLLAEEFN